MLVAQSCPTLWDPMDCSLSGSSIHGILQAGLLEWVAISFCFLNGFGLIFCRSFSSLVFSDWRSSFSICCKGGLVMLNSLNFCLSDFFIISESFPGSLDGEVSACNAEDLGSISGSGRFPGEGNGNPLQYSCLENPMD